MPVTGRRRRTCRHRPRRSRTRAGGRPPVGTGLLGGAGVDHDEPGLAGHHIVQPAPDLLLGVGVVLPAGLGVPELLDPGTGLLLPVLQVGDLGALGDVLTHRVGERDDQRAQHQGQQGGAAGEARAAGLPLGLGAVDAGRRLLTEQPEPGRGGETVPVPRGHLALRLHCACASSAVLLVPCSYARTSPDTVRDRVRGRRYDGRGGSRRAPPGYQPLLCLLVRGAKPRKALRPA